MAQRKAKQTPKPVEPEPEALIIDPPDAGDSGVASGVWYVPGIEEAPTDYEYQQPSSFVPHDPLDNIREWAQSLRAWHAKRSNGAILTEDQAKELDSIILTLEGHLR